MNLFGDTIVIIRPAAGESPYGGARPDWANATETTVTGVSVQPDTQAEADDGTRQTTTSTWILRTPIGGGDLDLRPTDRVRHGGRVLEVDGDIARWPHPFQPGQVSKVEARLRKAVDR